MTPLVSSVFLREDTLEALKRSLQPPEDPKPAATINLPGGFGAIRVYVNNDPASRKARAILEAMEGRSCIYEDEDSNLVQLPTVLDWPSLIDHPTMTVCPICCLKPI